MLRTIIQCVGACCLVANGMAVIVWANPDGKNNAIQGPIGSSPDRSTVSDSSRPGSALLAEWTSFEAEGLAGPVTGVVYRDDKPPTCGMPLGGISTGCLDLEVGGVWGFSTIFGDHTLYGPNPAVGLWRGVPRTPPTFAPFLGLSIGGKTWVLSSRNFVEGGEIAASQEPALVKEDWIVDVTPIEGVSCADRIRYWGHYPVAELSYETSAPVQVKLRAWSPFLPGDAADSNIPGAVFELTLRNSTDQHQQGSVAYSFDGPQEHEDRNATEFGHFEVNNPKWRGAVVVAKSDVPVEFAIGVIDDTTSTVRIGAGLGRDGSSWKAIHKSLPTVEGRAGVDEKDMRASGKEELIYSPQRGASVAIDFDLQPGESKVVRFVLAWYAPSWIGSDLLSYSHFYKTRYGERNPDGSWRGVRAVVDQLASEHGRLLQRVLAWQQEIYASKDLPGWLQDCLINSLAVIPETAYWLPSENRAIEEIYGRDGAFFGMLESPRGCPQIECIPCTWYGNMPIVYFFPELAQSTLDAYRHFQANDGEIPFTLNGLQVGRPYMSVPGYFWQKSLNSTCYVHLVDRQWRRTNDIRVLEHFYESVKKAMIFTMSMRPTPDGVISMPEGNGGMQWFETGEWAGMGAHLGGLRLAQCRIAERMAEAMNDAEFAAKCRVWLSQGTDAMENKMWNKEYYLNFLEEESGKKSDDIMANQLDGQWAARSQGLAPVFREDRAVKALATIKRSNVPHAICGAVNFVRPDGTILDPKSKVAEYGTHDMFTSEVLILAMTYMYAGEQEFGRELAHRSLENIACRHGYTWDLPNRVNGITGERTFGTDYYQNLIVWCLPAALSGVDLYEPCQDGGLVDRIIDAAAD